MIHNNVFVPLVFFAILTSLWVDSKYTNAAFQNQRYKQEHLTLFLSMLCIEWKSNAMPIQNPNNVTLLKFQILSSYSNINVNKNESQEDFCILIYSFLC